MRLLIDMNLSPKWVGFLGEAGFEAQHWSAIGTVTADDAIILAHAKAGGWVILTNDLDFGAILAASGGDAPSVVQIRADNLAIDAIGGVEVQALREMADALGSGALITIDAARIRVSVLPLVERQ